jgi:hypothetical protein
MAMTKEAIALFIIAAAVWAAVLFGTGWID